MAINIQLASPFFGKLPRELRTIIYEFASPHGPHDAFNNFEVPWDFRRRVTTGTTISEQQVEAINGTKTTKNVTKASKREDELRYVTAPAIIDYPMAFTCELALKEYLEDYYTFVGNQKPAIAFVVQKDGKVYKAHNKDDGELVDMVLSRCNNPVCLHCDIDDASDPTKPIPMPRPYPVLHPNTNNLSMLRSAKEAELCIYSHPIFNLQEVRSPGHLWRAQSRHERRGLHADCSEGHLGDVERVDSLEA